MPILYILTSYVYAFLGFVSYVYIGNIDNFIFYLTSCVIILNLLLAYVWLIYSKITLLVLLFNILNLFSLSVWYFQIYRFINYFLVFIILLNSLSSFFISVYLLKKENIFKIEKTILLYKKIFAYSHVPILLGLVCFGLVFVNDKETLQIRSQELRPLLNEKNSNLTEPYLQIILTKDFGFVKKIEIKHPQNKNILLQLSFEKNHCLNNLQLCRSLNYVRFYY